MSTKRLNKKTTTTHTISDETKDRNKYADTFIKDLRKLKSGEIQDVNIDYTKIKIKQSIKLIKLNIDDKKLVLTTDEGGEYFLNDRTINQIMTKKWTVIYQALTKTTIFTMKHLIYKQQNLQHYVLLPVTPQQHQVVVFSNTHIILYLI